MLGGRAEIGERADRDPGRRASVMSLPLVQWGRLEQSDRAASGPPFFHFGNHRWSPWEPPGER